MKRKNKPKQQVELKKNVSEAIQKAFGQNLKKLREGQDLSQEAMAFISGLSRSYYAEVESGKRNLSIVNISKILLATGVDFNQLLSLSDLKKLNR
jgi:transcriptional regulator with XRE-family HTH domain